MEKPFKDHPIPSPLAIDREVENPTTAPGRSFPSLTEVSDGASMELQQSFSSLPPGLNLHPDWDCRLVEDLRDPKTGQGMRILHIAVGEQPPPACPTCHVGLLAPFGWTEPAGPYIDEPIGLHWCGVVVIRRRWRCATCAAIHTAPIPGMLATHQVTERLATFLCAEALHPRVSYRDLQTGTGLRAEIVGAIFHAYLAARAAVEPVVAPRLLGIDDSYVRRGRDPFCMLTDLDEHRIIEVLESSRRGRLALYLRTLPGLDRVEAICTDMDAGYRTTLALVAPGIPHVIDRYHVTHLATAALDRVRIALRPPEGQRRAWFAITPLLHKGGSASDVALNDFLAQNPKLRDAYAAREQFRRIYTAASRAEADERYAAWVATIPASVAAEFAPVVQVMAQWYQPVMAYFDHPITNGVTESLHRRVRMIQRVGQGVDFTILRAKAIYGLPLEPKTHFRAAYKRARATG